MKLPNWRFWAAPAATTSVGSSMDRGNAYLDTGHADAAAGCFRSALQDNERDAAASSRLSAALSLLGQFDAADEAARSACRFDPRAVDAYVALGNTLLYRGRYGEAISEYTHALEIDPTCAEAHLHLTLLGRASPQFPAAIQHFEQRLQRNPDSYIAMIRLGLGYQAMGNLDAAMEMFAKARDLHPELPAPWASLATLHGIQGCPEQAIEYFQRALSIVENPIWRSTYLFFLQYSDSRSAAAVAAEHCDWGARQEKLHASVSTHFQSTPDPERRLKIGYMSGDFFLHPVAQFIEPILRAHDREAFEIHCYANVLKPDTVTARLGSLVDNWHDTAAMSDAAVCAQIRADGIDILVDLAGHTRGQRVAVLAQRAAPVQMTYLGYPGTTGLASVDYRITDAISDPPGMTEAHYTERLLRRDGCFLSYQALPDAPAPSPPPFAMRDHISFGSFNNLNKVNRTTIRMWADVLCAVPGSRLVIKHFATGYRLAQERILGTFAACGIDASRVNLLVAHPELTGHLDLYREIDIALDTFPYNGTTTTCEAMWMGVPVVTLAGDRHAARVGASLLTQVGLTDLIATDAAGYVRCAADLATDKERLRHLRAHLRTKMQASPLLDGRTLTCSLENQYRTAWQTWLATSRQ